MPTGSGRTKTGRVLDRRVIELARIIRSQLPLLGPALAPLADAEGMGLFQQTSLNLASEFTSGRIIWSAPALGLYKVQLAGFSAPTICTALVSHGPSPFGPRELGSWPLGMEVLVFRDNKRPYGLIVGGIPSPAYQADRYNQSDVLSAGLVGGFYRDAVHSRPIVEMAGESGAFHFGDHRPLDVLATGEFGKICPSGVGLLVSDYEAFLRVNEICGLFLNYVDSYAKLAGWNFDWETAGTQRQIRMDQGEVFDVEGFGPYLWEALGAYRPTGAAAREVDGREVLFENKPFGRLDLPEEEMDRMPFWRNRIYRGYLGQGEQRFVVAPDPTAEGFHRLGQGPAPIGLFREFIGLDGSYVVQSAKSVILSKRVLIPVPVQQRVPEDAGQGDGAGQSDYRFAGQYGSGAAPEVKEWTGRDGADGALKTAAGVQDVLARLLNWTSLHGFTAHTQDWKVGEEGEGNGPLTSNQAPLDLDAAQSGTGIPAPAPKTLNVDHRLRDVAYFENESYVALLDTGGIAIGDGFGAEIKMVGGRIYIDAPGGVHIRSGGTSSIEAGKDLVLKARGSIDQTATEGDIRHKAQRNFHVLAGNDDQGTGSGGILLESRGQGFNLAQGSQQLVGTDQRTGGIVLKAPKGPIVGMGQEIYLKTGATTGGVGEGPITLDASNGRQDVVVHGRSVRRYIADNSVDSFGPNGQVTATTVNGTTGMQLSRSLQIGGSLTVLSPGSSIVSAGGIAVLSGGYTAPRGNTEIGPLDDFSLNNLTDTVRRTQSELTQQQQTARQQYQVTFSQGFYLSPAGYGSPTFQLGLAFTFRDTPEQYGTQNYRTPEPRWFGLAREANYTGATWRERPVSSAVVGDLYPFPGKQALEGATLLKAKNSLVDRNNHAAVDRGTDGGPYRAPSFEEAVEAVPLNKHWIVLS